MTPSTKRTETGAAAVGRSPTVMRTSKQSAAALMNRMTVELGMCVPTDRVPDCAIAVCGAVEMSCDRGRAKRGSSVPSLRAWTFDNAIYLSQKTDFLEEAAFEYRCQNVHSGFHRPTCHLSLSPLVCSEPKASFRVCSHPQILKMGFSGEAELEYQFQSARSGFPPVDCAEVAPEFITIMAAANNNADTISFRFIIVSFILGLVGY